MEGKYDHAFLTKAIEVLAPQTHVRISYLELLEGGDATGGDSSLLDYLRANRNAIRFRIREAPLIVLLDWDSSGTLSKFKAVCDDDAIYRVVAWPATCFNPQLGKRFRGIERHMANRIIEKADAAVKVLGTTKAGKWTIDPEDYNKKFKPAIFEVVSNGITDDDLLHVRTFLKTLIEKVETVTLGS